MASSLRMSSARGSVVVTAFAMVRPKQSRVGQMNVCQWWGPGAPGPDPVITHISGES